MDLAVYCDPHHPYQVDRMLRATKVSLDFLNKVFSPSQFRQARILEFPGYHSFAESFANTIPYSEAISLIQDDRAIRRDSDKIDMVTFVTAHELGRQWRAHQVIGANMPGMTMLSETFAQYSAMFVMEHLYGSERVRKFLKEELDSYLRARGSEEVEELPHDRVEDQGSIHYGKVAVAMDRLKEVVDEGVVNRSLRRLLAQYPFKGAPYPSSKDFFKILREEAGPKYDALITDLFDKIALYDLTAKSATWTKRSDGKFDVAVAVDAHKCNADGKGMQTEVEMNEPVAIGLFLAKPGDAGLRQWQNFDHGAEVGVSSIQTFHVITARAQRLPRSTHYNEWIDRNSDGNVVAPTASGSS